MTEIDTLTRDIYDFIVAYIRKRGFSPTLREIGAGCYMSHTTVYSHLGILEGKDWIVREYNVPRSIRLGVHAPDYIAPDDAETDS
jgi:SOS-response transcriptional repressor LexA